MHSSPSPRAAELTVRVLGGIVRREPLCLDYRCRKQFREHEKAQGRAQR